MDTYTRINKEIPKTITLPPELKLLCDWVDKNGYPISGRFELQEDDGDSIKSWFDDAAISDRFGVFGFGPDGSIYAFWIDDDGSQKIVHLGSEGDALFILANTFIDFLCLLAIGYDEIGNADMTKTATQWNDEDDDESVNPDFQEWVKTTFKVSIPKTGNKITNTNNLHFKNWIHKKQGVFNN